MRKLSSLLVALVVGSIIFAQTPTGFSYQAVLRNSTGQVLGSQVAQLRVTLTSSNGLTTHYQELHSVTSNAQGLINVIIGNGTDKIGVLANVPWGSDQITMKTEIKVGSATTFTLLGTQPLQAVPYALYANNAKEVESSPTAGDDDPIFVVKNRLGQIVFAVYQEGVRVFVDDGTTKGAKGGFAVGGLSGIKESVEYFRITPDSVRIYIDDTGKRQKGGFAVGGLSGIKESVEYLRVTPDSTRIYVDDSGKRQKGGFAVGGLSGIKGTNPQYLNLTPSNYFIGHESGNSINLGQYNSILGYQSGFYLYNGSSNSFIGFQSGYKTTNGSGNLFFGYQSGYSNISGNYNTFLGYLSGYNNTSGLYNTFLGSFTGFSNKIGSNNTFVGDSSGYKSTGSSNTFLGTKTGLNNTAGGNNVFIGNMSGYGNTVGESNVYIGSNAGRLNNGYYGVFIGHEAGYRSSGTANVFVGYRAGHSNQTGATNVFLGRESGLSNTIGTSNVFLGDYSGQQNTSGGNNVFLGKDCGISNTLGNNNVFIGFNSGQAHTTGERNVFIGVSSGAQNNQFDNVMIGTFAGQNNTGFRNVFLGREAGRTAKGNNKLYIENSDADSTGALIFGQFDNNWLRVNDKLGIGRNPSNNFEVEGTASKTTAGDWLANSDRRIKTDIKDIDDAFSIILKLRPVKFKYTDSWIKKHPSIENKYYYNFIAQEYQQVFPESVKPSGELLDTNQEVLQLDSYNAQVVSIKAVQELIIQNQNQQQEIDALKEELEKLKEILKKIMK